MQWNSIVKCILLPSYGTVYKYERSAGTSPFSYQYARRCVCPFCQRIQPYRSPRAYIKIHTAAATTAADDILPEITRDWSSALP